jgi:hypothetical protein
MEIELVDMTRMVPACTLPTPDQPLRLAEWDALLADAVISAEAIERGRAKATLRTQHDLAARFADLAVRETECCSFFTFTLTATAGGLDLEISVPPPQAKVLDALIGRIGRDHEDDHD